MKKKKSGKGKKILWICLIVFVVIGVIEYIVDPTAYKTSAVPSPTPSATVETTPEPAPETTQEPAKQRETINGYYALHGTVQDVITDGGANGKSLIFKNKITSSYSDKATIDQNYYVIEDLILKQGATDYDEIQYWAVADMQDGSEAKVISFTVPKGLIDQIAGGRFPANTMGDYVTDLWILPSLKG